MSETSELQLLLSSSQGVGSLPRVAIVGSGPTGIYTLNALVETSSPLAITVFEKDADVGKGTPYHPHMNDQAMLANIASIELPPIQVSLVKWLSEKTDVELDRLNIVRSSIHERAFFPRIALGEYFQAQFAQIVEMGRASGHKIVVNPEHRVSDIRLLEHEIQLSVQRADGAAYYVFDHVVMATGHNWPDTTETKPGYFVSPWPAPILKEIGPCSVGILGTSLSALDALISVATAQGSFFLDAAAHLRYRVAKGNEAFRATLMSRKGILPEADFYYDYPYRPLQFCTPEAIAARLAHARIGLLDHIFELFRQEIAACDPEYASKIGLPLLNIDNFAGAYFADRNQADPFVWAATNLAEAEHNEFNQKTVGWRYAILRMHEVIAKAVPFLDETDLDRFHKKFKSVFVDDYATVPHQSIRRILALRNAGRLEVLRLGKDYEINTEDVTRGATVRSQSGVSKFDAFIDATGQSAMAAYSIPFPSLVDQGVVRPAATAKCSILMTSEGESEVARTGGLDLDDAFRPKFELNLCNALYCAAISFLLHKMPFVQGITSAHEIGRIVAQAIVETESKRVGGSTSIVEVSEIAAS